LIVGIAAIAMPVAASVYVPAKTAFNEQQDYLDRHIGIDTVAASRTDPKVGKGGHAARHGVRRQDDYYERRRQHWERRLDTRLDEEENGDNNSADEGDDRQQDIYDRRREYYRDRLDEDW